MKIDGVVVNWKKYMGKKMDRVEYEDGRKG